MADINPPAVDMVPITPDDDAVQEYSTIYIGGTAGNLVVVTKAGNTRTIPVTQYQSLTLHVTKITEATTATSVFGVVV